MSAERLLLRPEEAAEALGISRAKVYRLIAAGDIPHRRIGVRGVRVPLAALREWAASQETAVSGIERG